MRSVAKWSLWLGGLLGAATAIAAEPASRPSLPNASGEAVGEKVPSEDSVLADFHSLGLIDGRVDIFRCACPVRDLAKKMEGSEPSAEEVQAATERMKHLYDLGIRTDISFEQPTADSDSKAAKGPNKDFVLEKAAAEAAGITFVSRPIANSGEHSLQDMTDQQVIDLIDPIAKEILADAKNGPVVFHCAAGHDRTGIVTAYIRMKYQHWPVEQAIAEMRRFGHNWPKFSANGGLSSWHEDHLRAIAKILAQEQDAQSIAAPK